MAKRGPDRDVQRNPRPGPPGLEIRDAREGDVGALVPLMVAYCRFYRVAEPNEPGLAAMARDMIGARDDVAFLIVAVEDGGPPLGFAACQWKWSSLRGERIVYLDDIFVAEAARGRGIADALIEACAERARAGGATAMEWLTEPDNKRAQAVYDRLGGEGYPLIEYELKL